MYDIIVIIGPSSVGKTKLSISLAKMMNAEIINGDSVSIYKGLDIGSAKPTIEEREGIVHHLIDVCPVTENYSVYDYQKDVRRLIEDINEIEIPKSIKFIGKAPFHNCYYLKKLR